MQATERVTREDFQASSMALYEKLASNDVALQKEGEDYINRMLRMQLREDGFFRKIMEPVQIPNEELTPQVNTEKLVKVVEREPLSPAAISVPFNTLPLNLYIRADRYLVAFDRIESRRMTKDVDELRTWRADARKVFGDNILRDIAAEEDGKFLRAVNTALVGPNATVPTSGTVQYEVINSGIDRDALFDSMKILPNTPASLKPDIALVNHITINDICKFTHNEMGGTLSEDIMRNGWTLEKFLGIDRWIITIKKGLVPTNTIYYFAHRDFLGHAYILEDVTMYVDRRFYMLEFFYYETLGATIGNTSAVARVDFVT